MGCTIFVFIIETIHKHTYERITFRRWFLTRVRVLFSTFENEMFARKSLFSSRLSIWCFRHYTVMCTLSVNTYLLHILYVVFFFYVYNFKKSTYFIILIKYSCSNTTVRRYLIDHVVFLKPLQINANIIKT